MRVFLWGGLMALLLALCPVHATNLISWRADEQRLSADVDSLPLSSLLADISAKTGWQIYIEPGTSANASAKFKNLPLGDGLRALLGNLNFALVPQTNARPRLFVFRTTMRQATQLIAPSKEVAGQLNDGRIPNQLIVTLKPGANIDEIARKLGAKVVGKIAGLNAYLLQFEDENAAEIARGSLAQNPDVEGMDSNYSVNRPPTVQPVAASASPPNLKMKAPADGGGIIVGLVDTAVQSLGNGLDSFFLEQVKIAGDANLNGTTPLHGTSMAETILSAIDTLTKGNTSVKILPVDVYGNNSSSSTFDVAKGIVAAVNGGANLINLSLGSDGNSVFLQNVIQNGSKQGVIFVGAAGNTPVATPYYPAAYSEVIAVTAGDRSGNIASYANRGSFVDVIVPGNSHVSYQGRSYYVSGTSAAAAFATGMIAGGADATGRPLRSAATALQSQFGVRNANLR